MSSSTVLVKDIIESAEKYGDENVLDWSPTGFRDNKKNNKNSKFDCTWVPFSFKYANGNKAPLNLKFSKVVTSSSAKLPSSADGEIKNMVINFRKVTEEELLVSNYTPKKMDDSESQAIEDKKKNDEVIGLVNATNEFNRAIEIIDKSYQKVCKDIKEAKSLEYTVRKNKQFKTNKDISVFHIRQTHREDKEDKEKTILLELPLTRIKLLLNKTGQVGIEIWNKGSKSWDFRPNVHDLRKMGSKSNNEPVLATVRVNGKMSPLDKDNAGTFITYRSVTGGVIRFPEIVISKFGFSLANSFKELYVKRNKSNLSESTFSNDDIKDMKGESDDDDDEAELKAITDKISKVDITEYGSELEDNCDEEEEDDQKVSDASDLED